MAINPYAGSLTGPFEGNGDCIYDFKDRFISKTEGLRFNEQDQAVLIRSYLIGNAKNVYNKLTQIQKNNINVVFEQMIDKFALTDEEYMNQFDNLKFNVEDGVLSFSLKLESLLNKALHGTNNENFNKLSKNKFIKEMPSSLRSQLSMHVDENWDAIVSKARKAISLMDKDTMEINNTNVKQKLNKTINEIECYNCGQKGHFQSKCPLKRNSNKPYNRRPINSQNPNNYHPSNLINEHQISSTKYNSYNHNQRAFMNQRDSGYEKNRYNNKPHNMYQNYASNNQYYQDPRSRPIL
ncbi:unnamed protein product [Brachionus calyciflorus]|uniref:CCHC-type domain-containing protein n=1 Tax=Brachionus calyciflorus TaxID=104777 RepID=A0A814JCP1_9BILA|nr:unnamed protein product [Brachionus calyciflorus]